MIPLRQYLKQLYIEPYASAMADFIEGNLNSRQVGEIVGLSHQQILNRCGSILRQIHKAGAEVFIQAPKD